MESLLQLTGMRLSPKERKFAGIIEYIVISCWVRNADSNPWTMCMIKVLYKSKYNITNSYIQMIQFKRSCLEYSLSNCFFNIAKPTTHSYLVTGVFTGAIVLLALGVLTPFFQYIPKASLAALIMTAVFTMVECRILQSIWTVRRIDLLPLIVTFFVCFYEIEVGILCGIGSSLLILLYPVIWPPTVKVNTRNYVVLRITGNLTHLGVEHVVDKVEEVASTELPPPAILLDFGTVTHIDYTVVQGILALSDDLGNKDIPLYLSEVKDGVRDTLMDGGVRPCMINPSPQMFLLDQWIPQTDYWIDHKTTK